MKDTNNMIMPLYGQAEQFELLHEEKFVQNESQNPFARICCQTRRLTPTICDGTCMNCRKSRELYKIQSLTKLIQSDVLRSGGDNDYEVITSDEARHIIEDRISRIEEVKREIFAKISERQEKGDIRMQKLMDQTGTSGGIILH